MPGGIVRACAPVRINVTEERTKNYVLQARERGGLEEQEMLIPMLTPFPDKELRNRLRTLRQSSPSSIQTRAWRDCKSFSPYVVGHRRNMKQCDRFEQRTLNASSAPAGRCGFFFETGQVRALCIVHSRDWAISHITECSVVARSSRQVSANRRRQALITNLVVSFLYVVLVVRIGRVYL